MTTVGTQSSTSYSGIGFAFYLSLTGSLSVSERGTFTSVGTYAAGDQFQVIVNVAGAMQYLRNNVVVYTSAQTVTYPLVADACFQNSGGNLTNIAWVSKSVWCPSITCPASTTCAASSCVLGACQWTYTANGTACTSSNPNVVNAQCQNGQCTGTDLCANVNCSSATSCYDGVCSAGSCYVTSAKTDGTACVSNNPQLINTTCLSGSCIGQLPTTTSTSTSTSTTTTTTSTSTSTTTTSNLCLGVVCRPVDSCHAAGSCLAQTGTCTIGATLANGTVCAGSPTTKNNKCQGGVCIGQVRK